MSKRTSYTTCTPLHPSISRDTALAALRDHVSMIDLNPLVEERSQTKPRANCTPEEYGSIWYSITDRVSYLPGVKGRVTYYACFHDLPDGLQTHVYAPLRVDIQERWSVGGNEPGEPIVSPPMGIGAPREGLYLREDIDLRCNFLTTRFVCKNLRNAHATLVDRLVSMAHSYEAKMKNERLAAGDAQTNALNTPLASHSPISQSLVAPRSTFSEIANSEASSDKSRVSSLYQPPEKAAHQPDHKMPYAPSSVGLTVHSTSPPPHELDAQQYKYRAELE